MCYPSRRVGCVCVSGRRGNWKWKATTNELSSPWTDLQPVIAAALQHRLLLNRSSSLSCRKVNTLKFVKIRDSQAHNRLGDSREAKWDSISHVRKQDRRHRRPRDRRPHCRVRTYPGQVRRHELHLPRVTHGILYKERLPRCRLD